MSDTAQTRSDHLQAVTAMWDAVTDRGHADELQQHVLWWVETACKRQINAGNYDATVALSDLADRFHHVFVVGDESIESGDSVDVSYALPGSIKTPVASQLLFQRVVDELVDREVLLYVYDKQRVRSRAAEVTRYFALLRQRFADGSDFEQSPSLTKMVKFDIQRREKPKWGDEGVSLNNTIRETLGTIRAADPAPELVNEAEITTWNDATKTALTLIYRLCRHHGMTGIAAFQGRALKRLFTDAVTDADDDTAHVVTASTGGGKTEAFLFPILAYALTTSHPGIRGDGVDAVLAYPRKDLCNNQFERIVKYLHDLNQILTEDDSPFDDVPVTVALQHGSAENVEIECPVDGCDGRMNADDEECQADPAHTVEFTKARKGASADIIVVTPDTLHRRLMDHRGTNQFWKYDSPPKFVVLDEVHVYTSQYGMHVANVMRRFKTAFQHIDKSQTPRFVASSATISNAETFTQAIFGTQDAKEITPRAADNEIEEIGWEYIVFIKATDPRQVQVPQGEAKYKPRNEWDPDEYEETNVTNLSSMIQVAFTMYHTVLKDETDDGERKNKILGFVDSIDSVKRLGDYIQDAESGRGVEGQELFTLRTPDAFLRGPDESGTNPDCPTQRFRSNAAAHERAVCEPLPPNKHLNPCPVYEAGECWWTMTDQLDLEPMDVYLHKSGRTETPDGTKKDDSEWDLMVTTSALEVGFDHPGIIGTFQYRAPMNIPGFVQRKGRGGRDPDDQPISVVVLGSKPEDSFYFHHENLLSDPDDRYLEINLDEENEFVRTQHLVSGIFDYLNLTDSDSAEEVYQRLNIDTLNERFTNERGAIRRWLRTGFPTVDDQRLDRVLDEIEEYITRTQAPLTPARLSQNLDQFWEAARFKRGSTRATLESKLEDLKFTERLLREAAAGNVSIDSGGGADE